MYAHQRLIYNPHVCGSNAVRIHFFCWDSCGMAHIFFIISFFSPLLSLLAWHKNLSHFTIFFSWCIFSSFLLSMIVMPRVCVFNVHLIQGHQEKKVWISYDVFFLFEGKCTQKYFFVHKCFFLAQEIFLVFINMRWGEHSRDKNEWSTVLARVMHYFFFRSIYVNGKLQTNLFLAAVMMLCAHFFYLLTHSHVSTFYFVFFQAKKI